jgi:hypothetical protein
MYPSMLGIGRIETTHLLKHNGVFHYLVGIPAYPNPTTLRRFLQRISSDGLAKLRSVQSQLLGLMLDKPHPAKKIILDMDSTVLVLYGKQELATVGYNPIKRGRPSYHPLLCFDGITKDCIHAELRSGDTYTSSGTIDLLDASFPKIPQTVKRVFIRADKGFFDHDIIEKIEEHPAVLFTIAAKLREPDQKMALFVAVPHSNTWNRSSRVSVSTKQLEEAIPIYCYTTSNTGGPHRTTHAVFYRQIQLPSDGNKYGTKTDQHLAFLQRSRWSGAYYQRTEERLSRSEDSDQTFPPTAGRIIFSHSFVFL